VKRRDDELQDKIDAACRDECRVGEMFELDEVACNKLGLPRPQYRFTGRGLMRARKHSHKVEMRRLAMKGKGSWS